MIELAVQTKRPERVCGIHFFNPAPLMSLVEVVRPLTATDDTIAAAKTFAQRCGKDAVDVKDRAGFIVNALLFPYLNNAVRMLDHGTASMADIDVAMKGGCNFPLGPFQLLDLVGLDTSVAILDALYVEFKDPNYTPVPSLRRMVEAGPPRPQEWARVLRLSGLSPARCRPTRSSRRPPRGSSRRPSGAPDDLVCLGADLEPGTLLAAYRAGLFPMPYDRRRLGWWSPDPRGVLPLDRLRVTRSLRRSVRRYEVRIDTAFRDVITACATTRRRGGWITPAFIAAYDRLHELGWTHSVEAWTDDGQLAGGLYGVAIGGLFAGESMFHRGTDASKVALARPRRPAAGHGHDRCSTSSG